MLDIEIVRTFKAIEFISNGLDISRIEKKEYEKVYDSIQEKLVAPSRDSKFLITFDKEVKDFFEVFEDVSGVFRNQYGYYFVTDKYIKDENLTSNATVSKSILFSVIKNLKELNIVSYNDIDEEVYDSDFINKMKAIEASHDYKKAYDCDIKNKLTTKDTELEFKTLLALSQYPSELTTKIYEHFKSNNEFVLKSFKDFEVVDNRIIIPLSASDKYEIKKLYKKNNESFDENFLSMNAIVISKNPLDYYYASYGNAFQSCFSLTSSYHAWYGYVPYSIADESFIVYGTTGDVMKTSIISGKKFHCPQMIWRRWGYASKDKKLLLDIPYTNVYKGETFMSFIKDFFESKFDAHIDCTSDTSKKLSLFNKGKGIFDVWDKYKLKFYSDSLIKYQKSISFEYAGAKRLGERGEYTPKWMKNFSSFYDFTQTITSIKDIDISQPAEVINGILINVKLCPITGLRIDSSEDTHVYSKYFTTPSKATAAITYINGKVFLDDITPDIPMKEPPIIFQDNEEDSLRSFKNGRLYIAPYSSSGDSSRIELKTLKEFIKGNIKSTKLNSIFLRSIENDKVTCQVFKNKKETA